MPSALYQALNRKVPSGQKLKAMAPKQPNLARVAYQRELDILMGAWRRSVMGNLGVNRTDASDLPPDHGPRSRKGYYEAPTKHKNGDVTISERVKDGDTGFIRVRFTQAEAEQRGLGVVPKTTLAAPTIRAQELPRLTPRNEGPLSATFDELFRNVHLDKFLTRMGDGMSRKVAGYMRNVVRITPNPRGSEQKIADFREVNLRLIKGIAEDQVAEISGLLSRSSAFGLRAEDVSGEIAKILDVGESRAAFIARDQTLKMNGGLHKLYQENAGIEEYAWSGSLDERERPIHRASEGQRFKWGEPPVTAEDGSRNEPGQDFNCRCVAVPIVPIFEGIADQELPE